MLAWAGLLLGATGAARAQSLVLYFDPAGAVAGTGGSGTWTAITRNWTPDPAGTSGFQTWVNDAVAVFTGESGAAVTVALGSDGLQAGGLQFAAGTSFALVPGNDEGLTLSGPATVAVGTDALISAVLMGQSGLDFTGGNAKARLTLAAANVYAGVTTVRAGVLAVTHELGLGGNLGAQDYTQVLRDAQVQIALQSGGTVLEAFSLGGSTGLVTPSLWIEAGPGTMTRLTGKIELAATSVVAVGEGGGAVEFGGEIGQAAAGRSLLLQVEGDSTAYLRGDNTFTGQLLVTRGRVSLEALHDAGKAGPLGAGSVLALGVTGGSAATLQVTGAGASSSNRELWLQAGKTFFDVTSLSGTATWTGAVSGGPAGGEDTQTLVKTGAGTLVLGGVNTFPGGVEIEDGTLVAAVKDALGTGISPVQLGTDASPVAGALALLVAPGVELTRAISVQAGGDGSTRTLGAWAAGEAAVFSGPIAADGVQLQLAAPTGGAVVFNGPLGASVVEVGGGGRVEIGAAGTAGVGSHVMVRQGELRVNGMLAVAEGTMVAGGAKLSGTGTAAGSVFLDTGAVLAPGAGGVGTLTVGSLFLAQGSELAWQLGALSTTGGFDSLVILGGTGGTPLAVEAGAIFAIDLGLLAAADRPVNLEPTLNAPFWQNVQTWQITQVIDDGGSPFSPGAGDVFAVQNGMWAGGSFTVFVGGGQGAFAGFEAGELYVRFTPVPEPSTWVLMGAGAGIVLWWSRRRGRA